MNTKVMLVTTCRWYSAARLAIAFKTSGCGVEVVCPPGHPVERTSAVLHQYIYRALFPLYSIRSAIELARPALVIPCDDLATAHLHALHALTLQEGAGADELRLLMEKSLGDPAMYSVIDSRSSTLELAREEGVHVPETARIDSMEMLREWLMKHGFPSMLKSDGTSGGVGVKTIHNFADAATCYAKLAAPPLLARAAKRAIVDRDLTLILPCVLRKKSVVNVQKFVAGREATSTVACWKGKLLASIHLEVLRTPRVKGPASVVGRIQNPGISRAVEIMASRLGLSGLYGFDFILEEGSDTPYLIEINPRATQTCHLALGPQQDPTAALFAALTGAPDNARKLTDKQVIALFPQEWQSNPASPFLRTGYHDVPWEEPELVRQCIAERPRRLRWYSPERLEELSVLARKR